MISSMDFNSSTDVSFDESSLPDLIGVSEHEAMASQDDTMQRKREFNKRWTAYRQSKGKVWDEELWSEVYDIVKATCADDNASVDKNRKASCRDRPFVSNYGRSSTSDELEEARKREFLKEMADSRFQLSSAPPKLKVETNENKLMKEVAALKLQVVTIIQMKEKVQSKLEHSEKNVQLLTELIQHSQTDSHVPCIPCHLNSILEIRKRKLDPEKEVDNVALLALGKLEELRKYRNATSEKNPVVKKYPLIGYPGALKEFFDLKHQIRRLEKEKSLVKKENSLLKMCFLPICVLTLFQSISLMYAKMV